MEHTWWSKYKVDLPEGRIGAWAIERFAITEEAAKLYNLRLILHSSGYRRVVPGSYTRLTHRGRLVMSDTRIEIVEHLEIIQKATGKVLLNGLGLGLVLRACLLKPGVAHVTVIEIAPGVIDLVAPHLHEQFGERFTTHESDALTWKAPTNSRWDVVWHDIWNDLCIDNLPEIHKLHRRYGSRCDWQGSWGRRELQYRKQRGE